MRYGVLFGRRHLGQCLVVGVRLKATVKTETELASWWYNVALDDALVEKQR